MSNLNQTNMSVGSPNNIVALNNPAGAGTGTAHMMVSFIFKWEQLRFYFIGRESSKNMLQFLI